MTGIPKRVLGITRDYPVAPPGTKMRIVLRPFEINNVLALGLGETKKKHTAGYSLNS